MSELNKQGHHWIDRHPIYLIAVEKPPLELACITTLQWEDRKFCSRAPAPPYALKSRTWTSRLWNGKKAPPLESFLADLLFGGGRVAIGESMHLHVPISPLESMVHAPITVASFEAQIRGFPNSNSRNWQHFRIPHWPIYRLVVEPLPSEASRSSTRRWGSNDKLHACPRVQARLTHASTRSPHALPAVLFRCYHISPNLLHHLATWHDTSTCIQQTELVWSNPV